MTVVALPGAQPMMWPVDLYTTSSAATTMNMTATGHRIAVYGRVRTNDGTSKTLVRVDFLPATVVTAGTTDLVVDVQGVSTTAGFPPEPDGTSIVGGGFTYTSMTAISSNTWVNQSSDFGTTPTVTDGQLIAVQFSFTNYSGSDSFQLAGLNMNEVIHGPCNAATYNGTAWSAASTLGSLILQFSDGSFGSVGLNLPFSTFTLLAYDNADTPNEYGIKFQLPFSCRCSGMMLPILLNNNADDFVLKLYEGDTTVAASETQYGEWRGTGALRRLVGGWEPVTLTKNTWYRATIYATDGTNTISPISLTMNTANHLQAWCGTNVFQCSRSGPSGSWTDSATASIVWMSLLLSGFDDGASGGMLVHPGMTGGMHS